MRTAISRFTVNVRNADGSGAKRKNEGKKGREHADRLEGRRIFEPESK